MYICCQQGHISSKTLHPQNPPVVNWRCQLTQVDLYSHTHIHTRLTALWPGLPRWAGTRKVKPIWILLKQEIVSGSDISWAICKSALCSRQIATPAPQHSFFLQTGCPSCRPTNSIKALYNLYNGRKTVVVYTHICNNLKCQNRNYWWSIWE